MNTNLRIALVGAWIAGSIIGYYRITTKPPVASPIAVIPKTVPCNADGNLKARPKNIVIVFGYKDARPARFVGDRYERNFLVEKLLSLGFRREPDDDDLFLFEEIRLRLVQSSVGPDDEYNRRNPAQAWQSRVAKTIFLSSLKTGEVVFYIGHSRLGGGPDFNPPKLVHGKVDYEGYGRRKPGLQEMLKGMRGSSSMALLGLFSCASSKHFAQKILSVQPKLTLISREDNMYYMDSLNSVAEALTKLIQPRC